MSTRTKTHPSDVPTSRRGEGTPLAWGHGVPQRRSEGPRHRSRRWRGQAADAPHGRPGQAGGAVRRHLPADRLRAVERRQLRLPQGRRAHAVQVAQPRPARDAQTWRMSTMLGNYVAPDAGPAARRQALVPRQRRRDLPEPQPDQRREARHRRGGRRRPRLPDGLLADGRRAHRVRRRGDGGRHPAADRRCRPVRRHRRRARRPHQDPGVPREAADPDGLADSPDEILASMGNYVFDADALIEAVHADATPRRLEARHGRRHRAGLRRAAATPTSTTSRTT